ncbi:glycosyltransferase [Parabacteroides sp.]
MDEFRVSVAMAVYNGEKYVRDQIISILSQLRKDDELIISYDESSDNSLSILTEFAQYDKRVKIYDNPYKPGVAKNFQNALEHCLGDIIFLSDQDDVWLPDKLNQVLPVFEDKKIAVVFHDAYLTDQYLNIISESTFALRGGSRETVLGNLFRLSFIGCCMAFRSTYKEVILPIPSVFFAHDWWIGCLLGCGKTKMKALKKPLIYHRMHDNNTTPKKRRPLSYQLRIRWFLSVYLINRWSKKMRIDKQFMCSNTTIK